MREPCSPALGCVCAAAVAVVVVALVVARGNFEQCGAPTSESEGSQVGAPVVRQHRMGSKPTSRSRIPCRGRHRCSFSARLWIEVAARVSRSEVRSVRC